MNKVIIGLVSAAAVTTTILLIRQREVEQREPRLIPAGESQPTPISIERMREIGL